MLVYQRVLFLTAGRDFVVPFSAWQLAIAEIFSEIPDSCGGAHGQGEIQSVFATRAPHLKKVQPFRPGMAIQNGHPPAEFPKKPSSAACWEMNIYIYQYIPYISSIYIPCIIL